MEISYNIYAETKERDNKKLGFKEKAVITKGIEEVNTRVSCRAKYLAADFQTLLVL